MDPVARSAPAVTTMTPPAGTPPGLSCLASRRFVALGVSSGGHALLSALAAGRRASMAAPDAPKAEA